MNDTDIDLRRILGVLRRQLRLIIATLVVVCAIATIGAFALNPTYSATALVLYDTRTKNLLEPDMAVGNASTDSARVDSEVEILRSDNILLKVVSSENLVADTEFGPRIGWRARLLGLLGLSSAQLPTGEEALNDTLASLRNALTVRRRGLTYLIDVSVRSGDPAKAAQLATAISEAYIDEQLQSKIGSVMASRDILQARIDQARSAIVTSEESFDQFIDTNIQRITEQSGNSSLMTMQRQLDQLQAQRQANDQRINDAQSQLEARDFDSLVTSLQSDALEELQRQRVEISSAMTAAEADSPAALDLREQLAGIDEQLLNTASSEVDSLRTSVQANDQRQEDLRNDMRSSVLETQLPTDMLTELYGLQQTAEIARNQYQTLLSRVQDLDAQANLQIADSRLVSAALPPQAASFPNRPLIIVLAALVGLGLGIGLAFLYENLIGGFTSEEQVESVLGVRCAAAVPFRATKNPKKSLADLMIEEPLSLFAESIRRIRTAVDRPFNRLSPGVGEDREKGKVAGRVVMVTSTSPNDGKSTIALALARSYATSGYSTLLIDCDMRKPTIHRQLDVTPTTGLQDFLTSPSINPATLQQVVARDPMSSLTIIPGIRRSDIPTDQLLASMTFSRLIEAARATFDTIIIDSPPLGPVVDGLYIAPHCDAVVFVARWAATSQRDAKRAVDSLEEAKRPTAEVITVLNHKKESRSNYQQKYGSYHSEAY